MSALGAGPPGITQNALHACAEADRLAAQAAAEAARLRDARHQRAAFERDLRGGLALADRRTLVEAKVEALERYRRGVEEADQPGAVVAAVAGWLNEIDELNRAAALAAKTEPEISVRLREASALVERLEVEAEAARVAAAIARRTCLEARGAVGDERRLRVLASAGAAELRVAPTQPPPIEELLAGDRAAVAAVAAQLAAQSGGDANRVLLLLFELRDALIECACEEGMLDFPADRPFWGQFELTEARAVAAGLAAIGRGCDGREGWRGGRPAESRDLAVALSLAGFDPRSVRTRPTRAEIERLWMGTTVAAVEHLFDRAPDLDLESMTALLGPRAEGLAELWHDWAYLRPLLLGRG